MSLIRTTLCLMSLLLASPVLAKDVATEQYNASAARKQYNEARSEYDAVTEQVDQQAKRVAQEKTRLDELRARQKAASARADVAKATLKQREQALEKAWSN